MIDGDDGEDPDRAADSDRTPPKPMRVLTVREHTLVRHALHVVDQEAKRVATRFKSYVDANALLGVGTIELYAAAHAFDEAFSHDFADYARRRVRCAMIKAVGAEVFQERIQRAVDIATDHFWAYLTDRDYDASKHDDTEARRRYRTIANGMLAAALMAATEEAQRATPESESAERQEYELAIRTLRAAVQKLSNGDLQILVALYRDLKDLKEASSELKIPYSSIRRRHALALTRLRDELLAEGITRAPRPRVVEEGGGTVLPFRARATNENKPKG